MFFIMTFQERRKTGGQSAAQVGRGRVAGLVSPHELIGTHGQKGNQRRIFVAVSAHLVQPGTLRATVRVTVGRVVISGMYVAQATRLAMPDDNPSQLPAQFLRPGMVLGDGNGKFGQLGRCVGQLRERRQDTRHILPGDKGFLEQVCTFEWKRLPGSSETILCLQAIGKEAIRAGNILYDPERRAVRSLAMNVLKQEQLWFLSKYLMNY